ncbi:MAG TPA: glycosyltransferase [Thermotogota bacterium]|nr:glycosyltransferase [Thermotogota bacterium]
MEILYLTGAAVSPNSLSNLPFITNRIEALKSLGVNTHNVSLIEVFSKVLGALVKMKYPDYHRIPSKDWGDKIVKKGINYFLVPYDIRLSGFLKKYSNSSIAYEMLKKRVDLSLFDFVRAHWSFPEGVIGMEINKEFNTPYAITCHGYDINVLPYRNTKIKNMIVESLENSIFNIFVSKALLQNAKDLGYSGRNAYVIPNGFDPQIFRYEEKETARKSLNMSNEKSNYVGYVGNLIPVKGADRLPEIFSNICELKKNVVFVIVGAGVLLEEVKRKLDTFRVIFAGQVSYEEVATYMQAMDVLVAPSRNEGWGCVIKEAQACGTPVVGSNVGGIPEAIGDGGYVVDQGKDFEKRFAEAVVYELNHRTDKKMILAAAEGFSWEHIVRKEISLYELIGKPRSELV